jgi:UDP-N-acetyl-D-glucosamine dehydrogenase
MLTGQASADRLRAGNAIVAVVVEGLGYVGRPLATQAVSGGHEVVGYDTGAVRVKRPEAGESYVEDVSSCELSATLNCGRFCVSSKADVFTGIDVPVIAVPTPLRDGLPDPAYIEADSRTLARHLCRGSMVILESTSCPGNHPYAGTDLA